jgi:putative SOS response-associated peptidase YedK
MCTRYVSPEEAAIDRVWRIDRRMPWRGKTEIFPSYLGPFIRRDVDATEPLRELAVGQWNLIPWFAKEPKLKFATCNARSEELADKASYKLPWARGQRCIIPAVAFHEPCWETGKHVPWRFERADGELWGLAGLWNTWTDKSTGEIHESYTMLTLNADHHPIMSRMHRPDPKRPPDMQDKRSVVPIERSVEDVWLFGTLEEARSIMALPPVEILKAIPLGPTVDGSPTLL